MSQIELNRSLVEARMNYITYRRQLVLENVAVRNQTVPGNVADKIANLMQAGFIAGDVARQLDDKYSGFEPAQRRELIELLATLFDQKKWFDE